MQCHTISRRECDSVTSPDWTVSTLRGNEGACNFERGYCCICVFIIVAWIFQKRCWGRLGCDQGSGRGLGFVDTVWPSTGIFFQNQDLVIFSAKIWICKIKLKTNDQSPLILNCSLERLLVFFLNFGQKLISVP